MITKYEKANRGKLLVAVMALAVVLAGAAVIFSDSEVNATDLPIDQGVADLKEGVTDYALPSTISDDLVINGKGNNIAVANTVTVYGADVTFNNVTITSNYTGMVIATASGTGATITFNDVKFEFTGSTSTIYVDDGNSATFNNCSFNGVTVAYNQSAGSLPDVQFTGTTEGKPNMDIQTVTDATLGSDIITNGTTFGTITLYDTGSSEKKGTNLIVPAGEVLTADSIKNADNGKSTITVEEGGNIIASAADGIVKNDNPSMGISDSTVVFADDTVTFAGNIYLTGNLTIPEGKTLVFTSGSSLNLDKYDLTVEGTLVVESGAYVTGLADGGIVITPSGSIENSGVIGYQSEVSVTGKADDSIVTGEVKMMNVEGASFGIETTYTDGKASSILTVSGEIYATTGNVSTYTISVDSAKIIGTFSIDDGVEFTTNEAVVSDAATLTLDGDMKGKGLNMVDGSTVVINGDAGTTPIKAETGKYLTSATTKYATSKVTLNNVSGITLSVSSTTFTENRSNMTEQVLYISGTVSLIDDTKTGGITVENNSGTYTSGEQDPVTVNGIVKIAEDATLVLDENTAFIGGGIIVLGEIQYPASTNSKTTVSGYVGTNYTVKESASITTGYVTSFDAALAAIDTAENKKVTVYGELEIENGFDLADGQTVVLSKTDVVAKVTIGTDAKVTANKGSTINGAINEVKGILFVQKGASVTKPIMYAVSGTNATTGDITYAGFEAAISNSVAGDTITVVAQGYPEGTLTVDNAVEIPSDRTVVIDNGKTVEFEKNLTIADGSKLVNKGTVKMTGDKAVIAVNGTFDNTSGQTPVFSKDGGNVNVSGEYIVSDSKTLTGNNYSVNGAYYLNKGKVTVTTFAKAAAGAGEIQGDDLITIIGKISESGEVTVNGDSVTVSGDAVLGTVRIADTTITVSGGSLTATVVGSYGADGSTADASVALSKATFIAVGNDSGVDAMNVTTWYTSINAVSGAVTVSGGEIVYSGTTIALDETNKLNVATGATLVIPETADLDIDSQYFTVEGTLSVEGALDLSGTTITGTIDVTGTLNVPDTKTLTVTGTVAVSESEEDNASFNVLGTLVLGKTPEVLGTTTTGTVTGTVIVNNGTIVAYNGASVSDATIVDATSVAVKSTTLVVNDNTYATVYDNTSMKITSFNESILNLKDIEDGQTVAWYSDGVTISNDAVIGDYATVTTELKWAGVEIVVSAGPGLEIYIDDVERSGNTTLSVGEHTVTVYVKSGYTGTPTITFNGQTISGSTFTITSDMIGEGVVLYATGAEPIDYSQGGSSTGGDDGLGIVEILLIILVVVVVILAIFVVLRMMRS